MKRQVSLIVILCLALACSQKRSVEPVPSSESIHFRLGNPTSAKPDSLGSPNNFLIIKPQYALSYNKSLGHANWVAWELVKENFDTADRQDDFRPDTYLPVSWYRVRTSDYTN